MEMRWVDEPGLLCDIEDRSNGDEAARYQGGTDDADREEPRAHSKVARLRLQYAATDRPAFGRGIFWVKGDSVVILLESSNPPRMTAGPNRLIVIEIVALRALPFVL